MVVLSNYFYNTLGLYALLSLIPLIILYLIKPKPKQKVIPSLTFFMREHRMSNLNSFLQRLLKDLLFLLQLLVLILLSLTIAKPYMTVSQDMFVENSVIVLDVSGSMQTIEDGSSRFDKAIDIAKDKIGSRNTIILVTNVPQILVEDADQKKTQEALMTLKPRDTSTNLYDAMMSASDYAKGKNGKVTLISDMIDTETDTGYITAKRALESAGIGVEVVNVAKYNARNVGIIDIDVGDEETKVWIKNFNKEQEKVQIKVGDLTENILIEPGDVYIHRFMTPTGINTFEIKAENDDLAADNIAYISTPSEKKIKALIISNNEGKYLSTALSLIKNIQVEHTAPPKLPLTMEYDVFIIENVDKDKLLPRTMKEIKKKVENGSIVIITASDELFGIDFLGILPVKAVKYVPSVEPSPVIKILEAPFTKDMEFGVSSKYMQAQALEEATIISIAAKDNSTIMALKKEGIGKVFYYGMFDDKSEFKGDLYYPIFWKRLINFLLESQDINNLNFKTGKIIFFGKEESVETPIGLRKTTSLILDKNGIYDLKLKKVAANMASEKESRVNKEILQVQQEKKEIEAESFTKTKEKELGEYAILLALLVLSIELLYLKFRGDL